MNTQTPVVEIPIEEVPVGERSAAEKGAPESASERTWTEEIEVAGSQLVERVKELIAEGNVRRLTLRTRDNSMVLDIPLIAGAVIGGVLTVFAPVLVVVAAVASVFMEVKVEIVRVEEQTPKE
jgi:hypothetical protein